MNVATVAVIALFVLFFGANSNRLRNSIISAPFAFMLLGIVCGKLGFALVNLQLDNPAVLALAELTLVVVLFTDAARIDIKLLYKEHNLPIRLLGFGLPGSIIMGAFVAWGLMPALGLFGAAVLATIVAPTDAALAHAVVTKKIVPTRIRQAISVESGLNDGLALPLLLVFLCYAEVMAHQQTAGYWIAFAMKQITLGPVAGVFVGYFGGQFLQRAKQQLSIDHTFFRLSTMALALLAYGSAELVGGNGFIAAFVAGITVGNSSRTVCETIFDFGETEGQLLSFAVFFVFGAVLLPAAFASPTEPMAVLFSVLSLTVIRMLPACLSLAGTQLKTSSRLFISWFGPRGIASIVFMLVLLERAEIANRELMLTAAVLTVFLSVVFHGITANPLASWYANHLHRRFTESSPQIHEHKKISELPFFSRRES